MTIETHYPADYLRPELPSLPARIKKLPRARGYPVPWFVPFVDGVPEFRAMDGEKLALALKEHRCFVCGDRLGTKLVFSIGPMCVVNRISAEPPSHLECALFSAVACPFLTRPHMARRRNDDFEERGSKPAGVMLERNPGVTVLWTTRDFKVVPQDGGILFQIGHPMDVRAYAEGRAATPDEIRASFDSGLPHLQALAEKDGEKVLQHFRRSVEVARQWLGIPA